MPENLDIRESEQGDHAAIESLYPQAFPDEDLLPIVRDLLDDPEVAMSLVGAIGTQVVGHVIFTKCGVAGSDINASLLAPLAVAPENQRQGVGSAMVRAGLERLEGEGVQVVLVLGDPAYYGRLGFVPEAGVKPPYELPAEWAGAWQSMALGAANAPGAGKLTVPRQWLEPALWSP